jgi:fermentation-respiration switch protein FrsA (DUF1100 family)
MAENGTRKKKTIILRVCYRLAFILLLSLVLLAVIRFLMPFVVFQPTRQLISTPADIRLPFEDVFLTTSDGVRLHGWYIPAQNPRATLLFFHWNAGNISHNLCSIEIFNNLGLSVFIIGYRGYGQSEGTPSIDGTKLDALAAWQWLTEYKEIPAEQIVIFGRSLGGAIAMELTRSVAPRALIFELKFASLAAMSPFPESIAPFLLGGDFWNSEKTAANLTVPTLIIHDPHYGHFMYRQSRRVYEALAGEKAFLDLRTAHPSGVGRSFGMYVEGLDNFLTRHFGDRNDAVQSQ